MLIKNEYRMLQKENKLRASFLSEESQNLIQRLVSNLDSYHFSIWESEIIQKDLIGMALEAEQRKESFSQVIGKNEGEFLRSLTEGCRPCPWQEQLLFLGKNVFPVWFLFALVHIFVWSAFSLDFFLIMLLWPLLICLSSKFLEPLLMQRDRQNLAISMKFLLLLFWIGLDRLLPKYFPGLSAPLPLPKFGVILFFLLLWIGVEILFASYLHKSAADYRWQD